MKKSFLEGKIFSFGRQLLFLTTTVFLSHRAQSQNLCDPTNPNYVANGFEFLSPSVGCGPLKVKLKDKMGGTDVRYSYYYQGQKASELKAIDSLVSSENTYLSESQSSNYVILQYGKKADGKDFYSCGNVTVNPGIKPTYSYTVCSSGIEVVIPVNKENSQFSEFNVKLTNSGQTKTISKSQLPITLNFNLTYPDVLKIEGIINGQSSLTCNASEVELNKLDPAAFPNGFDVPFDINIDTLELVKADRARITFNGSLDRKGYTLQMRESEGFYPSIALKENVPSGSIDIAIPDPSKSYCFKLSRIASCGSYEFSAEICTTPITKAEIDRYGKINIEWINHAAPSTGQSLSQKKKLEISKVNQGIQFIAIPLSQNLHKDSITCGTNKVCYKLINSLNGVLYNYKYSGMTISNEVCLESDKLIAPPIDNLYATVNQNKLIDIRFVPKSNWSSPIANYYLDLVQDGNSLLIDSSAIGNSFENLNYPVSDSSYCFQVFYKDTCGIVSEKSATACTILLKESNGAELDWSTNSPFGDEEINEYVIFSQNETDLSFVPLKVIPSNENKFVPDLGSFENLAVFQVKATSKDGRESFSNVISVPLEFKLFVPDAFSPNGDGINDSFQIYGSLNKIKSFSIRVYNRSGNNVFESKEPNFRWDGHTLGNRQTTGVFNYEILITTFDGEKYPLVGKLFII